MVDIYIKHFSEIVWSGGSASSATVQPHHPKKVVGQACLSSATCKTGRVTDCLLLILSALVHPMLGEGGEGEGLQPLWECLRSEQAAVSYLAASLGETTFPHL